MRFARFIRESKIGYGLVENGNIEEISTTPFLAYERTEIVHDLAEVRLLAPCLPSKIVAIGVNYKDHAAEMGRELPETPMFFYKPSTAVIGPGDEIVRPPGCEQLDYEGELAVVIGSVAKGVRGERWREVVLGYTCAVDATARDWQKSDLQWGRAKGFDTSAPIGPWIQTELDPSDVRLVTRVNGEVKQDSRTSQLVFDVGAVIEFVTSFVTLLPGDVIMTGTPSGIGTLKDGDRIEVEIDGIGLLEVSVKEGS
jgi:2-keto-4-pentenoate hydratase/2-oxohepta-3-ene-1,7-dioic acid hydratase in catechol pathway